MRKGAPAGTVGAANASGWSKKYVWNIQSIL